ncbi:DUF1501 domain-containing protein [Gimesia aquarii]|uniref:Sulfatase n=1 Tax=Gimesia aquarii TaxID=2527964 RepID=A0A517VVW7_9PLAN|nr:DUF1501 domain-containing protein [Gimesia aquarii]QDT97137.1 hypothetical protein V144x_26080 [Gimesia aquarii]
MFTSNFSRRDFLTRNSHGFGAMALWHLLAQEGHTSASQTHFNPRAKNVIFIFMMGGPSHIDLFDPKPKMAPLHGEPIPESLVQAKKSATGGILERVMASPRKFQRQGQSGVEISELLPHTAKMADEICLIRSMHCEQSNHDPAQLLMHCGTPLFGNPSIGSWVNYGLGSACKNLPGYMVLTSDDGHGLEGAGSSLWSSGFMPSTYRGVSFRNSGDPILYLKRPDGISASTQRARLDVLSDLNQMHQQSTGDTEIASRIASYEMAFRMQSAAPELLDFSKETATTRTMYGVDAKKTRSFGTNCLLARRMVERGVRFVHLVHSTWDHHSSLDKRLELNCGMTDLPAGGLLKDLRQRGLLDDTLVVWAGEFGRTPMGEVRRGSTAGKEGRDHHPNAFSLWMAGGGLKRGHVHGRTDDFGFNIEENPVHVHDLQATILHLLGVDHEKLTYRHSGRDYRLTDVAGNVVKEIIA